MMCWLTIQMGINPRGSGADSPAPNHKKESDRLNGSTFFTSEKLKRAQRNQAQAQAQELHINVDPAAQDVVHQEPTVFDPQPARHQHVRGARTVLHDGTDSSTDRPGRMREQCPNRVLPTPLPRAINNTIANLGAGPVSFLPVPPE